MNSFIAKIVLLVFLVIQAGCDITFKKKYNRGEEFNKEKTEQRAKSVKKVTAEKISAVKEFQVEEKFVEEEIKEEELSASKENIKEKSHITFTDLEKEIIRAYFNDRANNRILHYSIKRSPISKKQNEKLRVSNYIPGEIQIVPLPIRLDNKLNQIPLSLLRVQVGKNIILMKVNSRKILDIVKL